MNRNQFTILLVLLLVLGGAGLYLRKSRDQAASAGEEGAGRKLLGDKFPVNDVAHIIIKQGTNELNLVNKDDVWRVAERGNYAANFQQISEFLIKAADLKVVQVEQVGPSSLARLQLTPPAPGTNSGTLVELKGKDDKVIKSLILGKKHAKKPQKEMAQFGDEGFPDGRYVMLAGKSSEALLVGDALSNVEPKPENWLKKDFFKVERPKSIAVTFPEATNSWHLTRDTESGEWKLADAKPAEKLDSTKVSGVTSPFSSPSFNDVIVGAKPEANGLDKPTVVTVETFDDFTFTVNLGKKAESDYPLTMSVTANFPKERTPAKDEKPADKEKADKAWKDRQKQLDDKLKEAKNFEKWTYLVPAWSVDQILKTRKDLMEEKKDEKKEDKKDDSKAPALPEIPGLEPK